MVGFLICAELIRPKLICEPMRPKLTELNCRWDGISDSA